jgi:hypothetical protein
MNGRSSTLLAVLVGILIAAAVMAIVVVTTRGDTETTTTATATTSQATTTTAIPTSTAAATTTTTATAATTGPTTTTEAFGGDTVTKSNTTIVGTPGPTLTDVRFGDHGNFVRVVFEFIGDGTPTYQVGYASPPFVGGGSGEEVTVLGSAFLDVHVQPGARYDIDTGNLVYTGDTTIDPGLPPIVEAEFVDDFETYMDWVIGLTDERPFTVDVLQDPLRLVIDIAK